MFHREVMSPVRDDLPSNIEVIERSFHVFAPVDGRPAAEPGGLVLRVLLRVEGAPLAAYVSGIAEYGSDRRAHSLCGYFAVSVS